MEYFDDKHSKEFSSQDDDLRKAEVLDAFKTGEFDHQPLPHSPEATKAIMNDHANIKKWVNAELSKLLLILVMAVCFVCGPGDRRQPQQLSDSKQTYDWFERLINPDLVSMDRNGKRQTPLENSEDSRQQQSKTNSHSITTSTDHTMATLPSIYTYIAPTTDPKFPLYIGTWPETQNDVITQQGFKYSTDSIGLLNEKSSIIYNSYSGYLNRNILVSFKNTRNEQEISHYKFELAIPDSIKFSNKNYTIDNQKLIAFLKETNNLLEEHDYKQLNQSLVVWSACVSGEVKTTIQMEKGKGIWVLARKMATNKHSAQKKRAAIKVGTDAPAWGDEAVKHYLMRNALQYRIGENDDWKSVPNNNLPIIAKQSGVLEFCIKQGSPDYLSEGYKVWTYIK